MLPRLSAPYVSETVNRAASVASTARAGDGMFMLGRRMDVIRAAEQLLVAGFRTKGQGRECTGARFAMR
jgi:hypothetical protein